MIWVHKCDKCGSSKDVRSVTIYTNMDKYELDLCQKCSKSFLKILNLWKFKKIY